MRETQTVFKRRGACETVMAGDIVVSSNRRAYVVTEGWGWCGQRVGDLLDRGHTVLGRHIVKGDRMCAPYLGRACPHCDRSCDCNLPFC